MLAQVGVEICSPAGAFTKKRLIYAPPSALSPTSAAYGAIMFVYPSAH
jgi:hypothetical protein